jgi:MoaA/NifB/PqqE/SkfB family radical SAM enzyme
MGATTLNYASNLIRLLRDDRVLKPLVISYCVTTFCNLNCTYCEDFGARRNTSIAITPLPLPDAQRLLGIVRQATSSLIVTGGEPLLYPDLAVLLAHAKNDLKFRSLTVLSNATLLSGRPDVLRHLDRLVISLDALEPDVWDQTLRAAPGTARTIIDTISATAAQQREIGFRLIVHCVLTPETLVQARAVLDFCIGHGIIFSCSPQSVNNWPRYELSVSDEYRAFITHLIRLKRKDAPILGSLPYLQLMLNFEPYACYPLLAPRIMPDGALAYPCRPIERSGLAHGGRAINLLEVGSWDEALRRAAQLYGPPPSTCASCYQQCYVEPSLMQSHLLALLREIVAYAPSRQAGLHTYAPG